MTTTPQETQVLRIILPAPFRRSFDYLPPLNFDVSGIKKGARVLVPFGYRQAVGVFIEQSSTPQICSSKLKRVFEVLDKEPLFSESLFSLCEFVSDYYHHPLGDVLLNALPKFLRLGMHFTEDFGANNVKNHGASHITSHEGLFQLNVKQQEAITSVIDNLGKNKVFLLDGITGSGKTEVYLQVIEKVVNAGKQALVLVPEINLTPQTVMRFKNRFCGHDIAVLHSRLTDKVRLEAWKNARNGSASIVIGTRSAIFAPLANPGIIVLDEEHDLSFKQQSGVRYSTRDVSCIRSKLENIPIVLGSATPSFESLQKAYSGVYAHLKLPDRVGGALHPTFNLVDIRKKRLKSGLSLEVIQVMSQHIEKGGQIIVFVNRRGYAPSLICHNCGFVSECDRCDVRLTLHRNPKRLCCHHCGSEKEIPSICPKCCGDSLVPCGVGTERLEDGLGKIFPGVALIRVDSDTTRKKGAMQNILNEVTEGQCKILFGTQMLTKGHHFPDVTMVVILNSDGGLFSADFRASEYLAQLILQVAGRAGRASKPGEVYIQTHNPSHPLLLKLIQEGYHSFAKSSMNERSEALLPPFSTLALFRAEGKMQGDVYDFLKALKFYGESLAKEEVQLFGPVPSVIERKIGKYRAQLLLQSKNDEVLHDVVTKLITYTETSPLTKKVKWLIDIDPVDIL